MYCSVFRDAYQSEDVCVCVCIERRTFIHRIFSRNFSLERLMTLDIFSFDSIVRKNIFIKRHENVDLAIRWNLEINRKFVWERDFQICFKFREFKGGIF